MVGPGDVWAEHSPRACAGQMDTCCSSALTNICTASAIEGLGGSCRMGAAVIPGAPLITSGATPCLAKPLSFLSQGDVG